MHDEGGFREFEFTPELGGERRRIVAHGRQPATALRTRRAERRHHNMPARAHALAKCVDVALTIPGLREKMKDRSIVPQRVFPFGLKDGHVLMYEGDRRSGRSQAIAKPIQSESRKI